MIRSTVTSHDSFDSKDQYINVFHEKLSLIEKRCRNSSDRIQVFRFGAHSAVVVGTWYALTRLYDKLWHALPGCTIVHFVASGIRPRGSKSRIFFWRWAHVKWGENVATPKETMKMRYMGELIIYRIDSREIKSTKIGVQKFQSHRVIINTSLKW